MINRYNRSDIVIESWLVTKDDLISVYEFIKGRFSTDEVSARVKTTPGNSRPYENSDKMIAALTKSLEDKVQIEEIEIYKDESSFDKPGYSRYLFVHLYFDNLFKKAFFHIYAADIDGSYSDWVEGTYSGVKSLVKRFEILDKELIDKIESRFGKSMILDIDGAIKKDLQEEIIRDKQIKLVSITAHNTNKGIINNINHNKGVINNAVQNSEIENHKEGIFNKILKHPIVATVVGSIVFSICVYSFYKITGININNPSENKTATSSHV